MIPEVADGTSNFSDSKALHSSGSFPLHLIDDRPIHQALEVDLISYMLKTVEPIIASVRCDGRRCEYYV